jgi:hypothetical protein
MLAEILKMREANLYYCQPLPSVWLRPSNRGQLHGTCAESTPWDFYMILFHYLRYRSPDYESAGPDNY